MKKLWCALLILILLVGNVCYAKDNSITLDRQSYNISTERVTADAIGLHTELSQRDKHHRNSHHRHHRHHHHDHDDDNDLGDIIAGIIIYEVVKEVLD